MTAHMSERLTDDDLRDEWRRMGHPNTTEMMAAILALRARVAKLEAALSETVRLYGRWLDGTFREHIEKLTNEHD
jgi:hypothetical protein